MTVHDAKEAITFYAKAFGATELFRLTEPSERSATPRSGSATAS